MQTDVLRLEAAITDNLCFFTDRNFHCGKYPELNNVRLYNLAGADLAEKGKILTIISDIFSETCKVVFYSAFERQLPCAVYLPELGALVSGGCIACGQEKITSRHYDTGRALESKAAMIEEIAGYTMSQSNAYKDKSLELMGIAELLLREYVKIGEELLDKDRVRGFAKRKIASMASSCAEAGTETERSISAITCSGYRFVRLPEDYSVIRLFDNHMAASAEFVKAASKAANRMGYDTIVSRAIDTESSPLHLMIPALKTVFVSESAILETKFTESPRITLERFYSRRLLDSKEHYTSFFGEYIKKMLGEAALYARICMDIKNQGRKILMPYINSEAAAEIASEIVYGILNN